MKRSKLLLIAGILSTLYVIYLIAYFSGAVSNSSGSEQAGASIASVLVMPHMVCTLVATIFNWLGYGLKARWAALVAGILYAVAMVLFFMYFFFVLIQMILCFVAYAKMKKPVPVSA